jgi:acyl-CoA synthetase (AMP-forming)/AMP-acid ligase II
METPLSPLEFMRRARSLYPSREAVVDGERRWTYDQFFDRCDRWSAVLQRMGIKKGDRVAYISPNIHAQLESYYAVPQLGAVLVPINYRLSDEEFVYLLNHSGARVLCVAEPHVDAVDAVRKQVPKIEHFVAMEGPRPGWQSYEALLEACEPLARREDISEQDLLTINYTSGTTSRPKGVMITHRNAWINSVGVLVHHHVTCADRYLWTLPMFHANGWGFVWTVTAVGGTHVCIRKPDPVQVLEMVKREGITMLCAAPTVLIGLANAPIEARQALRRRRQRSKRWRTGSDGR